MAAILPPLVYAANWSIISVEITITETEISFRGDDNDQEIQLSTEVSTVCSLALSKSFPR